MRLPAVRPTAHVIGRRTPAGDGIMRGLIVGSGISVLLLLAWVHLGLGALFFVPAPTPPRMVAASGPYVVTLSADSGPLVAGDGNLVSLGVRDRAGEPIANATVRIHADMTTMPMPVPDVTATARRNGQYRARLVFTMAGSWRLTVAVTGDHAAARVAFVIGVRWR